MNKIIAGLLALAIATLVNVAHAAEPTQWDKWGVAPYARSIEEACKKAPVAIDGFNLPAEVKAKFKKQVADTACKSDKAYLTPKMVLEEMWTGGAKPHVMNKKTVAELPVAKSPDGRPYNKDSVVEAAVAYSWTVVHEGKAYYLFLPWVCYNWSWSSLENAPAVKPFALPPPVGVIAKCPEMYFLKVNVWERAAIKLSGVEQTHAKEELGQNQFAGVPHVSKTHGGQFRKARADGKLQQSTTARAFRASLIMTPESQGGASTITAEEVLGDISVTGLYDALQFTRAQLGQWDAIRLVAINDDVKSPPRYRSTGVREIRFFNHLSGKKLGEWDSNPDPDCIMNVHAIE